MLAARILSPILDLSSAIDEANYGDYLGNFNSELLFVLQLHLICVPLNMLVTTSLNSDLLSFSSYFNRKKTNFINVSKLTLFRSILFN